MVGHGGSGAGSYLADPTSPIPSHCASIVVTSTLRLNTFKNNYQIILFEILLIVILQTSYSQYFTKCACISVVSFIRTVLTQCTNWIKPNVRTWKQWKLFPLDNAPATSVMTMTINFIPTSTSAASDLTNFDSFFFFIKLTSYMIYMISQSMNIYSGGHNTTQNATIHS